MEENKKHPFLKILLLDVSEFAGGAIGVLAIFTVLLGVLNYFNILSLSSLYSPLSILPKQETKVASPDTVRNLASPSQTWQTQTASKPTPTPQQVFTQKDAEQVFSAFVSQNLSPSITVLNNVYPVIPSTFEKDAFDYTWTAENSTISAHFRLSSKDKNLSYLILSIVTPQNTTPSAEFSAKIASQFFPIAPQDIWKCKAVNELISCENFWQDQNGIKRGINVAGPVILADNQKVISLSFCEFHKDSPLYENKSCLR